MVGLDRLTAFITANPLLATALSSLWGAVVIDLIAFTKTKEPGAFVSQFNVSVALWRYLQAFIGGFLGNVVVAGATSLVALYLAGLL